MEDEIGVWSLRMESEMVGLLYSELVGGHLQIIGDYAIDTKFYMLIHTIYLFAQRLK